MQELLIIDDDVELTEMLSSFFEREGYAIRCAPTLKSAAKLLSQQLPSLVILDIMLPDGSGLEFCKALRAQNNALPILLLTARGDAMDRVLGLELGADDYLAKPFEPRELMARIRALLRRANLPQPPSLSDILEWGQLKLHMSQRCVTVNNHELALTSLEFKLLRSLIQAGGQVIDRETLAAAIQPGNYRPLTRAVDVQVMRLRKKLQEVNQGRDLIQTVRGEGYALVRLYE
jgi:DNA-binding response OmpR family regulator